MTGGRVAVYSDAMGTLHVWSAKGNVPTDIADLIHPHANRVGHAFADFGDTSAAKRDGARVDLYLYTGSDSADIQRASGRLGARYAVSREAATTWLRGWFKDRLESGRDVVIVLRGGGA